MRIYIDTVIGGHDVTATAYTSMDELVRKTDWTREQAEEAEEDGYVRCDDQDLMSVYVRNPEASRGIELAAAIHSAVYNPDDQTVVEPLLSELESILRGLR